MTMHSIFGPFGTPDTEGPCIWREGQKLVIGKLGWAGWIVAAETRGPFVRAEGTLAMFGEEWPIWFHESELREGKS